MSPNVMVATAFLDAMKLKDLSQAPLAENLSYTSPLAGETIRGRERVMRILGIYLPVLDNLRVIRHIADGDYVATVWRARTSFGPLSVVYVFRIHAGKVAEIEAFYDPRAFLDQMGRWANA